MMKMTRSPAVNEDRAPFGIVVRMLDFHVGEQSSNPGNYIGADPDWFSPWDEVKREVR